MAENVVIQTETTEQKEGITIAQTIEGEKNPYEQTPKEIWENFKEINLKAQDLYSQRLPFHEKNWFPCGFADLYLYSHHAKIMKLLLSKLVKSGFAEVKNSEYRKNCKEWTIKDTQLKLMEAKPYREKKTIEIDFNPLRSHQQMTLKEEVLGEIRTQIALKFGLGCSVKSVID